jgi:transcriptional regulator with XRE-family HTH domain
MLGKRIHDLRLRQGLSQAELAGRAGLPQADLIRLEQENAVRLPQAQLLRLADGLKLRRAADFASLLTLNGRERRLHLVMLGLAKTGSVSLCGLFGAYRAAHEYLQWETHQQVIAHRQGRLGREELRDFLLDREAGGALEVDAAHFNRHYCDLLAEEFPGQGCDPPARFLFLIRDPYSWVESAINYFTQIERSSLQSSLLPNGLPFDLPRGDPAPRRELLDHFERYAERSISFWAEENRSALQRMRRAAPERSLVLRTHELSRSLPLLADFAGAPLESLQAEHGHANRAEYHVRVLHGQDPAPMQALFDRHCGDLLDEFFPGYRLADYLAGAKPPCGGL